MSANFEDCLVVDLCRQGKFATAAVNEIRSLLNVKPQDFRSVSSIVNEPNVKNLVFLYAPLTFDAVLYNELLSVSADIYQDLWPDFVTNDYFISELLKNDNPLIAQ